MAVYKIVHKPSLDKDFRSIPDKELRKIIKSIQALAQNPRPYGCQKLTGQNKYRVRQGDYRILYSVDDTAQKVRILQVGHRKDIYRVSEEKTGYSAEKKLKSKI
jgi:mRNA interferase RelE/StbE